MIVPINGIDAITVFAQYMPIHIVVSAENVEPAMEWCARHGLNNGFYPFMHKLDTDADYFHDSGILFGRNFFFRESNITIEFKLRFG